MDRGLPRCTRIRTFRVRAQTPWDCGVSCASASQRILRTRVTRHDTWDRGGHSQTTRLTADASVPHAAAVRIEHTHTTPVWHRVRARAGARGRAWVEGALDAPQSHLQAARAHQQEVSHHHIVACCGLQALASIARVRKDGAHEVRGHQCRHHHGGAAAARYGRLRHAACQSRGPLRCVDRGAGLLGHQGWRLSGRRGRR